MANNTCIGFFVI
ncbi:hypothetical protein CP082626L3_1063A, partial [Chlamydia psittaci 08-2626_L3]